MIVVSVSKFINEIDIGVDSKHLGWHNMIVKLRSHMRGADTSRGGWKTGFNANHYMHLHIRGCGAEMEWEQNPLCNEWVQHSNLCVYFETTYSKPSFSSRNGRSAHVWSTYVWTYLDSNSSWGQHGGHLGPVGPRWAPCWPNEPCYQGTCDSRTGMSKSARLQSTTAPRMCERTCKVSHSTRHLSVALKIIQDPG